MTIAQNLFFRGAASAVAFFAMSPVAQAQQATSTIDMSRCEAMVDDVKAMKCGLATLRANNDKLRRQIDSNVARSDAADVQIAAARKRGAAADAFKACTDFMIAGIKANRIDKAKAFEMAGGKFTDENTCPIAASFGFGRRAEAETVSPH